MSDQAAQIGHNEPPKDEATFDTLLARTNELIINANKWANKRPEIENDEQATLAKDFMDQLRKLGTDKSKGLLTKARMVEQEEATKEIADIRDKYRPLTRGIEICIELIRSKLTPWAIKVEEAQLKEVRRLEGIARQEREKAEAAAAEAEHGEGDVIGNQMRAEDAQEQAEEADKATQRAPTRAKIESAYGGRSTSLRTRVVVTIENVDKIPVRALRALCARPYVQEALVRAVREQADSFRDVPGIIISEERKAV